MPDAGEELWLRRWWLESWRIAVGVGVIVIAALAATDPPPTVEVELFRLINDLTTWWGWTVWLVMQSGATFVAVPVAAVALAVLVRHARSPIAFVAGAALAALVVGAMADLVVERGRPDELLTGVNLGYEIQTAGQGFPSSHTAIAFAAAVVLSPYVLRWIRWTLYLAAVGVGAATVYMGANLPFDVVAGAAFGIVVGSGINLACGIRGDRARPEALPG